MSTRAAARAASLVGTRFRAQGRDPATGLDCFGLVLAAHGISGEAVPRDYRLRGDYRDVLLAGARPWFRRITAARAGDVLVMAPAADQLHLGIVTAVGFVHADAGIGRVVETPGAPSWPVVAVLRRRRVKANN